MDSLIDKEVAQIQEKYANHFCLSKEAQKKMDKRYIMLRRNMFEDRQEHEGSIFWHSSTEPNCLAFFYFQDNEHQKALTLNA